MLIMIGVVLGIITVAGAVNEIQNSRLPFDNVLNTLAIFTGVVATAALVFLGIVRS